MKKMEAIQALTRNIRATHSGSSRRCKICDCADWVNWHYLSEGKETGSWMC